MRPSLLRFVFMSLLMSTAAWLGAQFTVTGTVSDDQGEALIGANVLIKGAADGTVTDFDGKFSLDISGDEATLVVSYTGYQPKEIVVNRSNTVVSITLETSSTTLDEILVVGYGTQRKEALTGSVTSLKSEDIEQVPFVSVEQALQGNVAGLQSNMGNGQPGSQVQVRIRGQGSISASSDPLYVVDGIPIFNPGDALTNQSETANTLANLNPNDIETLTILKDASATAIYGARAANGVVLITTKSGRSGKPKVNLNVQYGLNDWAIKDDNQFRGLTAREYTDLYIDGEVNRGRTLEDAIERFNDRYPDPISGLPAVEIIPDGAGGYSLGEVRVDTRWVDEITRTGNNQSYNLSFSGGNQAVSYFASGGYFDQESPIIGTGFDRYSTRINVAAQANDWLHISNNISLARTNQTGPDDATAWSNPMYNAYLLAPTIPVRNAQGQFYAAHKSFFMGGNNPVGSLSGDDDIEWTMFSLTDNLAATVRILEGLSFKSSWSVQLLNYGEFYFRNQRYGDGRNVGGFASETQRDITNWQGSQTLTYDFTVNDQHNFNVLAGYESNKTTTRSVIASAQEFPPNPDLRTLNNAASGDPGFSSETAFAFESIFGRVMYNWDYKYYVSASIRRDGSSRFGIDVRNGTFWSIGASWRLDQEDFINNIDFIDELKLRTSYGLTGNAEIGNFAWLPLISFTESYDESPGGAPSSVGNSMLSWEENKTFNIGVDFRVFDRVSGTIEYYNRESDNLLLNVPISRTSGFRSQTENLGTMKNTGVELTFDFDIVNTSDFDATFGFNLAFNENEITQLEESFVSGTHDRFFRSEGREFNEYHVYEWAGVNPDDGRPLFYTDETRTETTSDIGEAERFFIGKSGTPSFLGGFNTQLGWRSFFVNANFSMTWDNWLYDATAWVVQGDGRFTPRSQTHLVLDRWRQPGDITDVPQFRWGGNPGSNTQGSSRYIYDGTHIRLRNLTVGYDLPRDVISRLDMSSARIYFRGTNIWTWTRDENLNYDPEAAINGFMESTIPNLKTFAFGIDVGF